MIVFETVFSFGVNGKLVAVKAADGSVLWERPITGPSAGAAGPVAFSDDGQIVYAPITEIGGVNKLWAVSVGGGNVGPALSITGSCPGRIMITGTGVIPDGSVQIWSGRNPGSTIVSNGPCGGTTVDIARARVFGTRTADANGNLTVRLNVDEATCGRLFQLLDLTTCATSNVTSTP